MKQSLVTLTLAAALACGVSGSAFALSAKECSTKYQAAKQGGTLGGQKWNDFRKAECGADAAAAPASAPATTAAAPAAAAPATTASRPVATARPAATAADEPTGPVSFPSAVDPKYKSETAGKARMHTCLDGYKAAKVSGTLGGMHWIDKGGGYYSSCNTKLKGA